MADLEQMKKALRAAHAAGDATAAKRIAAMIKASSAAPAPEATPPMSPEMQGKMAYLSSHFQSAVKPTEREVQSPGEVFMGNLANGASFGFADEIGAGIGSLLEDRSYEEILQGLRQQKINQTEDAPAAAMAGELTGAVAMPLSGLKTTGKLGLDMVRGATTGAGLSGLYGFGSSEGGLENRAKDAAISGLMGATVGGLIPVAGAGIKKVAGALAERSLGREALRVAPSTEDLRAAGNAAYRAVDDAGVVVKPEAFGSSVDDIINGMRASGLQEDVGRSLTPKSADLADVLTDVATDPRNAGGIPFSKIDTLRRVAGAPASDMGNKVESALGTKAIEGLDEMVRGLTPEKVVSGDAAALPQLIDDARSIWTKMSKSQMIDDAMAASENYLSGSASGIRNQFARILKNPKLARGFSETEKRAMRKVINGSIPERLLNLVGGGLGQLGLMGGGAATGGIPGAIIGAGLATGARKGSEAVAMKNAEIVRALVASGKGSQVPQVGNQARAILEALMQRGTAAGLQQ